MSCKKVLIADDETTVRRLLERLLDQWGYEVVSLANGDDAWEALNAEESPDLVILDWMMPGKKGVELCRLIRESSMADRKYIIIFTIKAEKEDITLAFEAGADDFISKPFDTLELRARIRAGERIISLQRALAEQIDELQKALKENRSLGDLLGLGKKRAQRLTSPSSEKDEEHSAASAAKKDIFKAVEKNDPELLERLMQQGIDCNVKDGNGSTPLHLAFSKRIAELLLSARIDIEARNNLGQTPLHCASFNNQKEVVEFLLAHEARVNIKDDDGLTPLHWASQEGYEDIAKLLVEKEANLKAKNDAGLTPLQLALLKGQAELAGLLVIKGSDIHEVTYEGLTPLHIAAGKDMPGVIRLLLLAGAGTDATDLDGRKPIHAVTSAKAAELLLSAGARLDEPYDTGRTLLHSATDDNNQEMIEFLIAKGVEVNVKDENGQTPLHLASTKGHSEAAGLLISKGARLDARDSAGITPLHCAAQQGHPGMIRLLISSGAPLDAADQKNRTPLDFAVIFNKKQIVELLTSMGAHSSREPKKTALPAGESKVSVEDLVNRAIALKSSERLDLGPGLEHKDGDEGKPSVQNVSEAEFRRFGRTGAIREALMRAPEVEIKVEDDDFPPKVRKGDTVIIKKLVYTLYKKGHLVLYESGKKAKYGKIQKTEVTHKGVSVTIMEPPPLDCEETVDAKKILGRVMSVKRYGKVSSL
ncbi:MAG: ankyrin repeat domain-containing protein [Candidatus Eremiobacteraeota bacterium]|nr:ankyrin repeat domain-containing protein [Candidatus Eremiobacteraeota bacterium]